MSERLNTLGEVRLEITGFDCVCKGAILKREMDQMRIVPALSGPPNVHEFTAMAFYCQTCGLQYEGEVMTRRMAERVSPIEDVIMQAALEAEQDLEDNPDASLEDIGAPAKGNFVISIPPVTKKKEA
jgi:hypothetical protein